MQKLRVSSTTNVPALAKAIVAQYKEDSSAEVCLESVGASAVNQAIKALAVANGTLAMSGKELLVKPVFTETDKKHTAIILNLKVV